MSSRADTAEIAAALKVTKRAAEMRAAKEAWRFIEQPCRGGRRRLYEISSLPLEVQAALAGKVLSAATPATHSSSLQLAAGVASSSSRGVLDAAAPTPSQQSGASPDPRSESLTFAFDARPEKAKAEARARAAIVTEYFKLLERGFDRHVVFGAVARDHQVSAATLSRYLATVKGQPQHLWLALLCPRYVGRVAEATISAEAWETLKADYLRAERPSAAACIARLRRVAVAKGWQLPSTRTILRRLENLPRAIKVMKREGMRAAKALFPAQQRDKLALGALAVINGDGYKHNLWVRFPDGEIVRAKTWFWQDVYSSKILSWCTDKTEHTELIQLSFGDLVERFGIPQAVTIDNTLAAANKTMSGGISHRFRFKVREGEPDGVFKTLGVDVHWATPGHGQAKPIERAFAAGGMGEYIDKAPEFSGAWTGSSTKDKPEYDGRHRTIDLCDLELVIAREVAEWNKAEGRKNHVAQGRSFDAVFAESYQRSEIRRATEAQRRLWLLSTEPVRTSARDGAITLDAGRVRGEGLANRYWSEQLVDHAGKQLVARFDPRRLHEGVHVYTLDNRHICYAACDRPAGFHDANAARERNRDRNVFARSTKASAQALLRMSVRDAARTQSLAPAAGAAASIPAPRVVRPVFAEPLQRPERSAADRAEMALFEAEFETVAAPVNVLEIRSDADKHAHWKALDQRRAAGEQLAERDEQFWQHWQTQDYFRIAADAEAEFDEHNRRRAIG